MDNMHAITLMGLDHRAALLSEADNDRLAAQARAHRATQPKGPSRLSALATAIRGAFASADNPFEDVVPTLSDYPVRHAPI